VTWWGASRNCLTSHHDFIDSQLKVTKNVYLGWAPRYRQQQVVWLLTCRHLQNSVTNASSNTKWDSTKSDGHWLKHVSLQGSVVVYTALPAGGHYCCWWTDWCHSSGGWSTVTARSRGSVSDQSVWDLWWTKYCGNRFSPVRIVPPMLYAYPSITDAVRLATDRAHKQHSARTITGSHPCSAVRMFV
jgi:hypothetical protein